MYTVLVLALVNSFITGTVRMNPPSAFQWREFYFVKIFHNVMKFVVPLFFMSISSMVSHQESCSVAMIINKLSIIV